MTTYRPYGRVSMELLPVTQDYDRISAQIRSHAARELAAMLETLRPYIDEAFGDPGGVHDLEPSRLVAYTQLLKLHTSLLKDLGALYRVTDRPAADGEDKIPASAVAAMVEQMQREHEQALEQARIEAAAAAREQVTLTHMLSLQAAREQVLGSLERINRP